VKAAPALSAAVEPAPPLPVAPAAEKVVAIAAPAPSPAPARLKAAPAAALPQVVASAPAAGGRGRRIGALALGGVAVLSAGAAGLFALQARSAANDVSAAAANHQPFDADRDATGRRAQTLSLVFTAGAAVALGASVALFLR
jgi:hypothetical protein